MTGRVEVLEVSFVVVAVSHNPTILNHDYLIRKGLITEEWQPAAPPVCAYPFAQVQYLNGVSVVAQPDKLAFTQQLAGIDEINDPDRLAKLASGYINSLPEVDYRQVGFNVKAFVDFGITESQKEKPLLTPLLIKDGPWSSFQGVEPASGVRLVYTVHDKLLTMGVDQGTITIKDGPQRHGAAISGNIHRDFSADSLANRRGKITSAIAVWNADLSEIVEFAGTFFVTSQPGKRKHA